MVCIVRLVAIAGAVHIIHALNLCAIFVKIALNLFQKPCAKNMKIPEKLKFVTLNIIYVRIH